ncbi:hypothetical protein TUZN_1425 [Thermoproteus uzoniensis 768-20]|uniref:Uncharacterized protein n=2 Tax=Thermoproteus TaxID=2270 RepID=F2L1P2_THEU7|nr:hypothetical protein TUZN_1425 [Thermoproteus uzoniensis 768-20]
MATRVFLALLLLLSAALVSAMIVFTNFESEKLGNLSLAYVLIQIPGREVKIDGCVLYVVNIMNSTVQQMNARSANISSAEERYLKSWAGEFGVDVWPSIEEELRAANYSGPLSFDDPNSPASEALARSSRWAHEALTLAREVEGTLAGAGIRGVSVSVYVDRGVILVDVPAEIRRGPEQLARVKALLGPILEKYRGLKVLVLLFVVETPNPLPSSINVTEFRSIIEGLYRERGISIKDPLSIFIGIHGNIYLLETDDDIGLLRELVNKTVERFGVCPNGSAIYFDVEQDIVRPAGYRIAWRYAVLELAGLAMIVAGSTYLATRALRKRRAA